MLIFIMMDRSY